MQQRVGPVTINLSSGVNDHLTIVDVPTDCVGFVMGKSGATLRSIEEEWGTVMFFAQVADGKSDEQERLCIFGPLRARRGAELKVMSAVEHKSPGQFVRGSTLLDPIRVSCDEEDADWGIDTLLLGEEDFSYALGAKGSTRRKLATASGCILEYVGKLACFCGHTPERRRARDYMDWLLMQRTGTVSCDPEGRDDVTVVDIPSQSVGFITGRRGDSLRRLEQSSGCFCFTNGARSEKEDMETLLIFSHDQHNRDRARRIVRDRVQEHKEIMERHSRYDDRRDRHSDRYDDRRDRRDRDRYDNRRDRRDRDRNDDRRDRRHYDDRRDDRRDRHHDRRDRDHEDRRRSRSR